MPCVSPAPARVSPIEVSPSPACPQLGPSAPICKSRESFHILNTIRNIPRQDVLPSQLLAVLLGDSVSWALSSRSTTMTTLSSMSRRVASRCQDHYSHFITGPPVSRFTTPQFPPLASQVRVSNEERKHRLLHHTLLEGTCGCYPPIWAQLEQVADRYIELVRVAAVCRATNAFILLCTHYADNVLGPSMMGHSVTFRKVLIALALCPVMKNAGSENWTWGSEQHSQHSPNINLMSH